MNATDSHPLSVWIEKHTTRGDFARQIGCSISHLANILCRRKRPSLDLLDRIALATSGAIDAGAFRDFEVAE